MLMKIITNYIYIMSLYFNDNNFKYYLYYVTDDYKVYYIILYIILYVNDNYKLYLYCMLMTIINYI